MPNERKVSDLVALATIMSMLLSVVAWGLKLEGELNTLRVEVSDLKVQIAAGILPRAEERIDWIENRVKELGDDFDDHDEHHENVHDN